MTLIYGSVCSGIEAASVAWEPLGWKPAWFAQFDPDHDYKKTPDFPSAVLAYHWPHVVNLGDMTKIAARVCAGSIPAPDLIVGGTPCQAFSVAGARSGLSDPRGQLTISYGELADAVDERRAMEGKKPAIFVWENVPGVLSSKDNAFGAFLGLLAGEDCNLLPPGKRWANAGYVRGPKRAIAWRILDAQYFGVAQRRRRVFVVASARRDIDPAKILFESEGVRRDIAPSRSTGKETTATTGNSFKVGSHWDNPANPHPTLNQSHNTGGIGASNQELFSQRGSGIVSAYRMLAFGEYTDDETASTCKARDYKDATDLAVTYSDISRTLLAKSNDSMAEDLETYAIHGTQDPDTLNEMAHTLGRNHGQENAVIAFSSKDNGQDATNELSPTIRAGNSANSNQNGGQPTGHNNILPLLTSFPTRQMKIESEIYFYYSGNIESLVVRVSMELNFAATVLKELGHVTRLEIYKRLIKAGPQGMSVGDLQKQLEIPASTLSHHISSLISVSLVRQERQGRTLYCHACYKHLGALIAFLTEECCSGPDGLNDNNYDVGE